MEQCTCTSTPDPASSSSSPHGVTFHWTANRNRLKTPG